MAQGSSDTLVQNKWTKTDRQSARAAIEFLQAKLAAAAGDDDDDENEAPQIPSLQKAPVENSSSPVVDEERHDVNGDSEMLM
jgi:hypothetical protein